MKNLFYPLFAATALVTAACSNSLEDDATVIDPSNKTAISFVGEDNSNVTRAGFAENTLIAMHIRSTNATDNTKIRETRTQATAIKDGTLAETTFSSINVTNDADIRYWDDAYGRSAQLSVFAVAVPKQTVPTNNEKNLVNLLSGDNTWNTGTLTETIEWTVSNDQSVTETNDPIANEDLVYSNNISANGKGGVKSYNYGEEGNDKYTTSADGTLQFRLKDNSFADGPGKFDQGNLKFNHALSRITINLFKGNGYGDGSFDFASDTNVEILGVPTSGTLNIETGNWITTASNGITKMATATRAANAAYSLVAQVIPGYVINKDVENVNVLQFIIDDNKYFITEKMMFEALNGKEGITEKTDNAITMEKGRNYVFNITVGKSKIINVSATLEKWTDVTAENQTMDNSHISLDLFTSNGTASTNFDLYRLNDESLDINTGASTATNWGGNYTDKATLTQSGTVWTTDWFFENNKAFYHFRTVNSGTSIKGNTTTEEDYFEITSGDQASHDYHWGAPFIKTTSSPIQYSKENGYTAFLSPAIGATNSTISMTELHMMSNINVVLRTTKTSDAVKLVDNNNQCEITLTHFYANGQVKMGNGLVSTTGDLSNAKFTNPTDASTEADGTDYIKTKPFTFAVVPQALTRTDGTELYVGITIKTPDNNQYYVVEKLSDIIATANGGSQNQNKDEKIDFWYPNHSYTYTFTLTKAGIKNVTCTVEDWVTVTAKDQNISLED